MTDGRVVRCKVEVCAPEDVKLLHAAEEARAAFERLDCEQTAMRKQFVHSVRLRVQAEALPALRDFFDVQFIVSYFDHAGIFPLSTAYLPLLL